MAGDAVQPGDAVIITDAFGREHHTKALSVLEVKGHTFPVVWVERPLTGGGWDRAPWPVEAVRPDPGDS